MRTTVLWSTVNIEVVNVLHFYDSGKSTLSASVNRRIEYQGVFTNSWMYFTTSVPATNLGLPLLGAFLTKRTNPAAQPGVSGNSGITMAAWLHALSLVIGLGHHFSNPQSKKETP